MKIIGFVEARYPDCCTLGKKIVRVGYLFCLSCHFIIQHADIVRPVSIVV